MTKKIAILMTCHNRKMSTLKCLSHLYAQDEEFDIFLVDDGSVDGTSESVLKQYPEVNIINGNGSLYWNRGMHKAWSAAEKYYYDYFVWLNDDTYLFPGALNLLIEHSIQCQDRAVIVGASCAPSNHSLTTFGADFRGRALFPNGELQECDAFGGNFVMIPRLVYKTCGKLDDYYRHSLGDIDYAKTVLNEGFRIFLASRHTGECINDSKIAAWRDSSKPIRERIKLLHSPLSYSEPKEFFYFYSKHHNIFVAILHVISIYLKLVIGSRRS